MHVLGRGFSQRRSSNGKRPRDLHIRKVSFSGSSLSGCSVDSVSTTTSSNFTARDSTHAPPRLQDRPLISPVRPPFPWQEGTTFFDDDDDDDDNYRLDDAAADNDAQPGGLQLPPHATTPDHNADGREDAMDYFLLQFANRPPLPRSHWSESTIQSVNHNLDSPASNLSTNTATTADYDDEEEMATPQVLLATQATTLHLNVRRAAVGKPAASPAQPQRPPMKTVNSVENYIKRGGWKRRGIVFHKEDVQGQDENGSPRFTG